LRFMTKRKFALLAGAVTGSLIGMAAPAQAATGLMLVPSAFAVATLGLPDLQAGCSSGATSLVKAIAGTGFQSKSRAILSGQVSQLERIRLQQQGLSQAATPVATIATYSAAPALDYGNCLGFAQSRSSFAPTPLGSGAISSSADDFLGSKRLLVHWTPLNSSWNRVRSSTLSSKYAETLLGQPKGALTFATLASVNSWTNRHIRYVEDQVQYGKADYWADARTTLRRRAGDCEDIAIAKMQLLAALGLNRSDMYLTIARDMVRNADHALLIVKFEGRNWLLDDSTDTLLDASASYDYRPIISFSQSQSWLHGYSNLAANVR
jgi:predicted transglutaminase-like cysteine proteinase